MVGIVKIGVPDCKVINNQGESNITCGVLPQAGGEWTQVVTMLE